MSDSNPYASPAAYEVGPAMPLEPPQDIHYQQTEEDFVAAMQYTATHVPEVVAMHKKRRLLYLGVGGLFCVAGLWTASLDDFAFNSAVAVPAALGALFLYRAAAYAQAVRRQVRARTKAYLKTGVIPLSDEQQHCLISTDGVVLEEPMIRTRVGWPKVLRVSQTDGLLLIYVQPSTPTVIPGRAFASQERFEGFCRLAQRLWVAGQQDS